jgi:hypothetical protein
MEGTPHSRGGFKWEKKKVKCSFEIFACSHAMLDAALANF